MSYLKSNFNVCAFETLEDNTPNFSSIHEKLLAKSFTDLVKTSSYQDGFVAIDNIFKTNFNLEDISVGSCVAIGYRYDTKKVPKALIKKLFLERLADLKRSGTEITKEEKETLKQECQEQLLIKALPSPNLVGCIWDIPNKRIYLDSKSEKIIEAFKKLFEDTFGFALRLYTYKFEVAARYPKFLNWLWGNVENHDLWLEKNVVFNKEKTTFNFTGTLEPFMPEIETMKNNKDIKKIVVGAALGNMDFSVSLNSKNFYLGAKSLNKINHESVETAIIDNVDRINLIINKFTELSTNFNRSY